MINQFMKKNGEKSFYNDIKRIDYSKLSKDIKEKLNINYSRDDSVEHSLDIYYKDNNEVKPILIDIHGGGFISNDKELNHLFGNYMAQKGFVVFNINYRLAYPKYNVFDQVIDIDCALKWIIKNFKNYNANIDELYIAGHSSAGVLAVIEALLCKSQKLINDFNLDERNYEYKGIILDCGLMNFYKNNIAYWGMRRMIFPKQYKNDKRYKDMIFESNNELYKLPQIILLTNSKDELRDMTYYFKNILDNSKVDNKLIDKGTDGHMGIIFKTYTQENQKSIDEIMTFFNVRKISNILYLFNKNIFKGDLIMAFDYKKEYKEFYMPKNKPSIVEIPKMNYIAVRGTGNPNEENGDYQNTIGLLYGIAYTIKMSYKGTHKIDGFFEYVVPPLEGFWWQDGINGTIDYNNNAALHFISIIRLPDFVSKTDFDWAIQEATKKKKQDFSRVEFLTYDEGLCVQCMHIGSYDDEPTAVNLMHEFAKENGYELDITDKRLHHEIYLSDPRKCEVNKLKTVIRHPIKK